MMDLATLPASAKAKAALKAALQDAGAALGRADRVDFYLGAMHGANDLKFGYRGPVEPELAPLMSQVWHDGREFVMRFPL